MFDLGEANRRISEFVQRPENRALQPGTADICTPFRGTLFRLNDIRAISERLPGSRVDVLWLGSNPCVPDSLHSIQQGRPGFPEHHSLEQHIKAGAFSPSKRLDDGSYQSVWDPIEDPKGGWKIYSKAIAMAACKDQVAMANFVPWGSKNLPALLDGLTDLGGGLLDRVMAFSDDLNEFIVRALRPKLIIIPRSLGDSDALGAVTASPILRRFADKVKKGSPPAGVKPQFHYWKGEVKRGRESIPTLWLPHPSALRRSDEQRTQIEECVASEISAMQAPA